MIKRLRDFFWFIIKFCILHFLEKELHLIQLSNLKSFGKYRLIWEHDFPIYFFFIFDNILNFNFKQVQNGQEGFHC